MSDYEEFQAAAGREGAWFATESNLHTIRSYLNIEIPSRIFIDTRDEHVYPLHLARTAMTVDGPAWMITAGVSSNDAADRLRQAARSKDVADRIEGITLVHDRTRLDLADATFDLVLALGAINDVDREHDQVRVIRELRRVMKPGGILIFSARTRSGLVAAALLGADSWSSIDDVVELGRRYHHTHYASAPRPPRRYPGGYLDLEQLTRLLTSTKLRQIDVVASGGIASWIPEAVWDRVRAHGEHMFHVIADLVFSTADDVSLIGISEEILAISKKID